MDQFRYNERASLTYIKRYLRPDWHGKHVPLHFAHSECKPHWCQKGNMSEDKEWAIGQTIAESPIHNVITRTLPISHADTYNRNRIKTIHTHSNIQYKNAVSPIWEIRMLKCRQLSLYTFTYFIAMYLHRANMTVSDIDIVCKICVKCMWNSKYTAHGYLKSMRPRRQTKYRVNGWVRAAIELLWFMKILRRQRKYDRLNLPGKMYM